jgi:dihydrofolate reductase
MSVIADITVSLDGFVTGPHAGVGNGLGDDGEPLHRWVFEGDAVDRRILDTAMTRTGAVVMGRNLFDVVDAPDGWSEELAYGGPGSTLPPPPVVVVTRRPVAHVRLADRFRDFAPSVERAIEIARGHAGDRDVIVMGGGAVIRSCLAAGLVDRLILHVAPLVLGGGTPLFADDGVIPALGRTELVPDGVDVTPYATHLHFRTR